MAINFTEPSRKNVTAQFESQASTEVSSTIGGQSVKFTVSRPNKFKTPTVGDAIELSDILEGIDIRYVASTAGYSHGDAVGSWANSGSLSGFDLFNSSVESSRPTFNIGDSNNPFSTGAMKFVCNSSDDSVSQHLSWGNAFNYASFTANSEFTMYMVASKFVQGAPKTALSPLWVDGTTTGVAETKAFPVFYTVVTTGGINTSFQGDKSILGDSDLIHIGSGESTMGVAVGDPVIMVVTLDSSNNFSGFDFNAKNVFNESKSIGAVVHADPSKKIFANSFGGPSQKPNGPRVASGPTDGDTFYVAEFGYFEKKIEGQKAAALGRLLKEKYQIS